MISGEDTKWEKDHTWALEASTESSSGLTGPGVLKEPFVCLHSHPLLGKVQEGIHLQPCLWGKRITEMFPADCTFPWEGDVTEKNWLCPWTQLGGPGRTGLDITTRVSTTSPCTCCTRLLGLYGV